MLQGVPALLEFGGGAFAECTDASDQPVCGSCVHVRGPLGLALGVPDWDVDPDPGTDITLFREGGQAVGGGLVQRGETWVQAAVMSGALPGSVSETHNGVAVRRVLPGTSHPHATEDDLCGLLTHDGFTQLRVDYFAEETSLGTDVFQRLAGTDFSLARSFLRGDCGECRSMAPTGLAQ